jgi:hypothetical protein
MKGTLVAALAVASVSGLANAQIWNEVGDAGDLPASAQVVMGAGSLTQINGFFGANDADMYRILITNPAAFSATTFGGTTLDTQLWLFHVSGMGIAHNDDVPAGNPGAGTLQSMFPVGNPLYASLAPGEYLIAITRYDRDPVSAGGLIFPNSPFNVVHGPTGPGGGSPITGWLGTTSASTAQYSIYLTGAGFIPAPGALALFGLAGLAGTRRRRA